ncbi:MAG: BLUF domain-containing protein [Anaerolineae bacterium]|nr:BLUF domain-containing protein [Anaerolineae bacterium]
MGLIALVYVSVSKQKMPDDELRDLLHLCRERNGAKNITGMLLYRDSFFIQALEGEETLVDPLYERIKQDPRHQNVLTVYRTPIQERSFENWTMGFNRLDTLDLTTVSGYTDFLEHPFNTESFVRTPNRARILLQHFRDRTYF